MVAAGDTSSKVRFRPRLRPSRGEGREASGRDTVLAAGRRAAHPTAGLYKPSAQRAARTNQPPPAGSGLGKGA